MLNRQYKELILFPHDKLKKDIKNVSEKRVYLVNASQEELRKNYNKVTKYCEQNGIRDGEFYPMTSETWQTYLYGCAKVMTCVLSEAPDAEKKNKHFFGSIESYFMKVGEDEHSWLYEQVLDFLDHAAPSFSTVTEDDVMRLIHDMLSDDPQKKKNALEALRSYVSRDLRDCFTISVSLVGQLQKKNLRSGTS